jgi:hypothetical protein
VLLACAVAVAGCEKFGKQLVDMQSLGVALQTKYNRPVKVTVSTRGVLDVVMTQPGAIDTMKFTRSDCSQYAREVAAFAVHHYPQAAALTYVGVSVIEVSDYGPAHVTHTYCTGGGPPSTLPADTEPPDMLKRAETTAPTR